MAAIFYTIDCSWSVCIGDYVQCNIGKLGYMIRMVNKHYIKIIESTETRKTRLRYVKKKYYMVSVDGNQI